MHLDLKSNIKKYVATELKSYDKNITKATVRTNNRIAKSALTASVKEIRATINIKAKDLKAGSFISKGNFRSPGAAIVSTSKKRGIPLIKYGGRATAKGRVSFAVRKGSRKRLPSAFIVTMPSGHKGIFQRKLKDRLPIRERFGPAAPALIGSRRSFNAIQKHVNLTYNKEFQRNYAFYNK